MVEMEILIPITCPAIDKRNVRDLNVPFII